jgi:hypothetical protein
VLLGAARKTTGIKLFFTQEEVVASFKKLYPSHFFQGFRFPMIEDLLDDEMFTGYYSWLESIHQPTDGALGPLLGQTAFKYANRALLGEQAGAAAHKATMAPVVSFGLSPDEHYEQALVKASLPSPIEQATSCDLDIHYAAYIMANCNCLQVW